DGDSGGGTVLTALLEGTARGVAGRVDKLVALWGGAARCVVTAGPPPGWAAYPWPAGGVGLKLTCALSGVPSLLAAARAAAGRHGVPVTVRGSAGVGVLYAGAPAGSDPDAVA